MVDIPGLIEGAHAGKGMGREFLRHVERCRVIVYLVDVGNAEAEQSYRMLRSELVRYDPALLEKPSLLALTKTDTLLGGAEDVSGELRGLHERSIPISAVKGDGLVELVREISRLLK